MTIDRETVIRLAREAGTSEAGLNIQAPSVLGIFQRFAAMVLEHGRKPLTDEQIEKGREATFSTSNPFCPCDSKTMRKAVRWAERAHGITNKESSDAE